MKSKTTNHGILSGGAGAESLNPLSGPRRCRCGSAIDAGGRIRAVAVRVEGRPNFCKALHRSVRMALTWTPTDRSGVEPRRLLSAEAYVHACRIISHTQTMPPVKTLSASIVAKCDFGRDKLKCRLTKEAVRGLHDASMRERCCACNRREATIACLGQDKSEYRSLIPRQRAHPSPLNTPVSHAISLSLNLERHASVSVQFVRYLKSASRGRRAASVKFCTVR